MATPLSPQGVKRLRITLAIFVVVGVAAIALGYPWLGGVFAAPVVVQVLFLSPTQRRHVFARHR